MSSFASFFKHNKKVIGLAFIVLAVVILLWILLSRPKAPKGDDVADDDGVKDLSAHFQTSYYTLGASANIILVSFIPPTSLGDKAKGLMGVLAYLVDKDTQSALAIPHPSIDILVNQPLLQSAYVTIQGTVTPGIKLTDQVIKLKSTNSLTVGKTYMLGIAVMNDVKSTTGDDKIPNIYSDFVYIDVLYSESGAPGTVSDFSGKLGF